MAHNRSMKTNSSRLHRPLLLAIFVLFQCWQNAGATPALAFAWKEIALTTEGGTRLEASVGKKYQLTRLVVTRNGRVHTLPDEVLKEIAGVSLNDIVVYEEPPHDYVRVVLKAPEFSAVTGNWTGDGTWSIRFDAKKVAYAKHEKAVPQILPLGR